ncbi:MAG: hypothetical protein PVJ53_12725, partial [Desulfobacterales bacterium]
STAFGSAPLIKGCRKNWPHPLWKARNQCIPRNGHGYCHENFALNHRPDYRDKMVYDHRYPSTTLFIEKCPVIIEGLDQNTVGLRQQRETRSWETALIPPIPGSTRESRHHFAIIAVIFLDARLHGRQAGQADPAATTDP